MRTQEIDELFDAPAPRGQYRRMIAGLLALASVAGIVAIAIIARTSGGSLAELRVRRDIVGVKREADEFLKAAEGEDLRVSDVVRSNETGEAQVDFFDGSLVRLDVQTEITVRELSDARGARRISLELTGGRTWNRVADLVNDADRYEMRMPGAVASVRGTTFMVDCRNLPTCYVVGVSGVTVVDSTNGDSSELQEDDCVQIAEGAIEKCDAKALGLIDGWAKENLADDQQLALETTAVTPRAPEVTTAPPTTFRPQPLPTRQQQQPQPTPQPTVAPTAKPTPKPTPPPPTDSPEPTRRPRRTPDASCEPGGPDSDCFPDDPGGEG
jgi:hypothetical protein